MGLEHFIRRYRIIERGRAKQENTQRPSVSSKLAVSSVVKGGLTRAVIYC
jgi:hypothetical protein